jgi:hypothetical protein
MAIKSNITDRRSRREKFKKEIVLISGGFAKREAFPEGKITVYPWDSTTDAWLTEAASKATGIDRDRLMYDLMAKVCNLNGCALEDFFLGDVNTVLMTARSIANQSTIQYLTICPKCGHEEVDTVQVPGELKPIGQKTTGYTGTDTVTLAESKEVVDVRPLRIRDELAIAGRSVTERERISNHVAHIIAPIVTVNATQADRVEELLEWYESLSPADAQQLEDFIENATPHLSQELAQKCDSCGNLWAHRLVLDQEFFRTGRMGTAGRALAANL